MTPEPDPIIEEGASMKETLTDYFADRMTTTFTVQPAVTRTRHWRWVVRYQPVIGALGPEPQPDWHPDRVTRVVNATFTDEAEAWNALRAACKVAIESGEHTPNFDPRMGYLRKFGRWEVIEPDPAAEGQPGDAAQELVDGLVKDGLLSQCETDE